MPSVLAAMLLWFSTPGFAEPQAKLEECGWLVLQGDMLVPQPDKRLQPSDPKPLATPPESARAAFCARDTIMTYVGG
jgi:hypothetical protein